MSEDNSSDSNIETKSLSAKDEGIDSSDGVNEMAAQKDEHKDESTPSVSTSTSTLTSSSATKEVFMKLEEAVTPASDNAFAPHSSLSVSHKWSKMLHSSELPSHHSSFSLYKRNAKEEENVVITNKTTLLRIKRDLTEFYASQITNIHVVPEEDNISRVHALIQGPSNTPYTNGFFYFTIQFPADYPIKPPKVKLITTGRSTVGFNPNLYANGYVCLSILNTWSGPQWSPVMNMTSVLLSIQSLMNEEPYFNEPGREYLKPNKSNVSQKGLSSRIANNMAKYYSDVNLLSEQYNEYVRHETIRVAVLDMLEDTYDAKSMPQPLKDIMVESFKANYHFYEDLVLAMITKQSNKESNQSNKGVNNSDQISPPISPTDFSNIEEFKTYFITKAAKKIKSSDDSVVNLSHPKGINSFVTKQKYAFSHLSYAPHFMKKFKHLNQFKKLNDNNEVKESSAQSTQTSQESNQTSQSPNISESAAASSVSSTTSMMDAAIEFETLLKQEGDMIDNIAPYNDMPKNEEPDSQMAVESVESNEVKKPIPPIKSLPISSLPTVGQFSHPLFSQRNNRSFDYQNLLKRLQTLKKKYNIPDKTKTNETANESNGAIGTHESVSSSIISASSSYTAIASNFMEQPSERAKPKPEEYNVEDVINDADYYMSSNDDYDLYYESESSLEEGDDDGGVEA